MKFTSAKFKRNDFKNQRGYPPPSAPHQVQRDPKRQKEIDDLKKNSVCKACDQRGHWKGDPECPKTRGGGPPSSGARRP
eukprot:2213932-Pyramimonas_sp.AAC.1